MGNPRYIAKRLGNNYVLVRVGPHELAKRLGMTTAGMWLVGWGASRRGLGAALATVAGAAIAYRGWTGHNPLELLSVLSLKEEDPKQAPSYPHHGPRSGQLPEDAVDEAAMESFPASDPPASHHSTPPPEPVIEQEPKTAENLNM